MDILGNWLADLFKQAYLAMVKLFQDFVIAQPIVINNSFTDYLYGNAIGVYGYLAICVAYVTFICALVWQKARVTFAMSLLVGIVIGMVGPLWFAGADQVSLIGDQLTKAAVDLGNGITGQNTTILPDLGTAEPLVAITMYGITYTLALGLYMMFVNYAGVAVLVKFFSLIVFSIFAIGDRTRKIFSFIVALGIVTMVIGKPVAALSIALGQALIKSFGSQSNSMALLGTITAGSMFVGLVMQPVLLFLTYKAVSPIMGRVAATVRGRVETLTRHAATAKVVATAHAASLQGRARAVAAKQPHYGQRIVKEASLLAIAKAATTLAAKRHPAGLAASVAIKAIPKGQKR